MSRKILKIGTDVLTLNDKLVSVKEDYPFWKVNSNTMNQYFNALVQDLRPLYNISDFDSFTSVGSAGGLCNGLILAPNGSLYTCPTTAPSITKITPNPLNPNSPTISYIGNFGVLTNKFASQHLVGDYIYFVPNTAAFIIQLNWKTDAIVQIGSFGTGAGKWGAASLSDDGRIFCPPSNSTDWLIIDVNDPSNVTTLLHARAFTGLNGSVNGGNGFIYAFNTTNAAQFHTKINTTTLVETTIAGTNVAGYRVATLQSPFNYNGIIYWHSNANGFMSINTATDTFSILSSPVATVHYNSPCLGADGWLYFTQNTSNYANVRFNPLNLSTEVTSTANLLNGSSKMCMASDGRMYGITSAGLISMRNTPTPESMSDNRLFSRYSK